MSTLRFSGPAQTWLECLPLGDGRLGAMTDGGVGRTTFHLNDTTAWSGSPDSETAGGVLGAAECARHLADARAAVAADDPHAAEAALRRLQTRYSQAFLPMGTARITTSFPDASDHRRELDLGVGIHRAAAGGHTAESFIAVAHSVLVHVISPGGEVSMELASPLRLLGEVNAQLPGGHPAKGLLLRMPSDVSPGHEPDEPAATWSDAPGAALEGAIATAVVAEQDRTVVLVACATTYTNPGETPRGTARDAWNSALARLEAAAADGVEKLRADHERVTKELLGAVALDLGPDDHRDTDVRLAAARTDPRGPVAADPALVALLFDYGRYLLASASRPGGLPATLQGIWNDQMRPPWSSNYTLNINTEMNYWGAHATQLDVCAEPLVDFTLALAERARPHTRRLYDAPGWAAHHNSDAWGYSTPVGLGNADARWAHWPLAGAWLARHLVSGWDLGATDEAHLRRSWPTLRGAAEFALAWSDGGDTSPATSPENAFLTPQGPAAVARTSAMDLALVRDVLGGLVRVADALGEGEDDIVAAAAVRLAELPTGPSIAPDGTVVEWDVPREEEDPQHRHLSHLFGLYPGDEDWSHAQREAAEATLRRRGDDSTGWSLVWKLALWARLGRGDKVSDILRLQFREATSSTGNGWSGGLYPNLFAAHPPFQIDGNLGYVGAVAELFVQGGDVLRLLPALPDELATGSVRGLVARPGIIVDLSWRDGELTEATLRARTPRACGPRTVEWQGQSAVVDVTLEGAALR